MKKASAILLDPATQSPRLQEVVIADLQRGEVRVRMLAAPIHPADLNAIEGKYPGQCQLGREGVGVVEAAGPETTEAIVGSRVLLPGATATWCEACVCRADDLIAVADELDDLQAATLRINPASALRMLRDFVTLQPGEWVLQNASNSAVGRSVIQLAKALGFRSISLVRRSELIDELRAEGADLVLLDDEHAVDAIRRVTPGPRLALNAVGGESALRLANALGDEGTLVTYGAMGRQPVRLPNGLLIFKDLRVRGFWVTRWAEKAGSEAQRAMMSELVEFARRGVLRTKIERTYPLGDFVQALEHAKHSSRAGKIVLTMS